MMKKLLSLPPNVVSCFHEITGLPATEYFVTSDPAERKLGSGGGTAWLLSEACHADGAAHIAEWLPREKRILLHAGGQSRRLPAYAPSGKVLTPIPVFRWARGGSIDQTLLAQQLPLYTEILKRAPETYHTLVVSGDVLLRATEPLQPIPEDADVVCYGLWADPEQASHHGVFVMPRTAPEQLDFMLQKPSTAEQAHLMQTHLTLMDIGVWLLSDRAVKALLQKTGEGTKADDITTYDLYSEFGCALGAHPSRPDAALADLRVKVLPLPGGEFYHYGTAPEMITSSVAIQNLVKDQRRILQKGVKFHSSVFTQNAVISSAPTRENTYVWIENSYLPATWTYTERNIITGVPRNTWKVSLRPGQCVDIVPIGEKEYALRPYGYDDAFRGSLLDPTTLYLGAPIPQWLAARGVKAETLGRTDDLQAARLFPVSADTTLLERLLHWFLAPAGDALLDDEELRRAWEAAPRLSADEISARANLRKLFAQRSALLKETLPALAENWPRSVFYQIDLKDLSAKYKQHNLPLPAPLPAEAPLMTRIHDAMFRAEVLRTADVAESARHEAEAFGLLREGLTQQVLSHRSAPRRTTHADQIVWARGPVRIDVAGGWTDTPPYALLEGGNVVNFAINLNGQSPLQVYVKPCREPIIVCRSIDLGAVERIETYEALAQYNKVGSPFSIPKAALTLAGFLPGFGEEQYPTLRAQLEAFGSGIEVTLFSAIPAGSGLGTSSILAATTLGALSDFCGLGWDRSEICNRTLVLEQMLTTGGGWQDQYGGVLPGIKLLQTATGFSQTPVVRYLPTTLFDDPETRACHLLYYTGITRTAKEILAEIVRGMFLNSSSHLSLLASMRSHALAMYEALSHGDFSTYGGLVRRTWEQNRALDPGTCPPAVEALCQQVDDYCHGYKLPGAGGGGYLYMVAKDAEAARRIREILTERPSAPTARFVEMSISHEGLQVSRS